MGGMWSEIERFAGDEGGATAVEYGLVATLIAVAAIAAIAMTGNGVTTLFGGVEERATTVFDEADV